MKANKCLYILRTLRKEQYNQTEIDHLFRSLVLPNITYGLSIYDAFESDLKVVQRFLDRCYKRNYISEYLSYYKSRTQKFLTQSPPLMIIPLL